MAPMATSAAGPARPARIRVRLVMFLVPSLCLAQPGPGLPRIWMMSVSASSNGRIRRPGGAEGMVDDALSRGGDDRHGRSLRPVVEFPPQACRHGQGER